MWDVEQGDQRLLDELRRARERVRKLEAALARRGVATAPEGELSGIVPPSAALQDMAERAWVGHVIADAQGRIQEVNSTWLRMHGYGSREEVIGRPLAMVFPGEEPGLPEALLRGAIAGEPLFFAARTRRSADGTTGVSLVAAVPGRQGLGAAELLFLDLEAQRALELHRALVENSLQGVIILQDDCVRFANWAACEIMGYELDEFLGMCDEQVQALIHPEERRDVWAFYLKQRRGEMEAGQRSFRVLRKDGSIIWLDVLTARTTYHGEPAVQIVCVDITQQQAAQRELQAAQARYEAVVEEQSELICRIAPDLTFTFVNQAFCSFVGRDCDDLIGEICGQFIHPEDREIAQDAADQLSPQNPSISNRLRAIRHDGAVCWMERVDRGIFDGDRLVEIQCVARDVTDQVELERALRSREQHFRVLVEQSPDGIVHVDRDARVAGWNPGMERISGMSAGQALGHHLWEIEYEMLPPEERTPERAERLRRNLLFYIEEEHPDAEDERTAEWEVQRPDGERRVIQARMFRVRGHETLVAGTIMRDVTIQRRLERERRALERLSAVGYLAGGVAHEFNNLLTVINGYTEFILGEETAHALWGSELQSILAAGGRAAELTQQLLAVGQRQMLTYSSIRLDTVVAQSRPALREMLGPDIALRLDLAEDLPTVQADAVEVRRILSELLANARDAIMRDAGQGLVTISAEPFVMDKAFTKDHPGAKEGRYVRLAVSDTGAGIEPQHVPRLFEPFFTTKPMGTATGLGLASVYGSIKQLGGNIYLESTPGEGTTVELYFPEHITVSRGRRGLARDLPELCGEETVLVIESDERVRHLTTRVLGEFGYDVLAASYGHGGLELARDPEREIDLVVTDVALFDLSGRELGRRLQRLDPELPILYLSAYDEATLRARGLIEPDAAVLTKPYDVLELGRRVRQLLDAARGSG